MERAAYLSGSQLFDQRLALSFDYAGKAGVVHTEILAPKDAPRWVLHREQLWNGVEAAEKRDDARVARELHFDLAPELNREAQLALTRTFLQDEFVSRGMVADLALHEEQPRQPHVHCMLTMRDVGPNGWSNKRREWDRREALLHWRAAWAHAADRALANEGIALRIGPLGWRAKH